MTRVMVVEDERIVALNLKQRLVRLGYEVSAMVASGEKALAEIEESRPDVVLMDINIEGDIDGIETASRIPADYHTPVIYLTAYSEQATLDRAKETKPYGYLLKPFSERELHATIQMALARRNEDVATLESERRLGKTVDDQTAELQGAIVELKKEIGARTKLEAALAQSQKMEAIGQLTGGIAHDFNNILQGIEGSLSIAQRRLATRRYDEVDRWIEGAVSSTRRAAGLTHRLLAFARRQPLSPTPVRGGALLIGMQDLMVRTMGETIATSITTPADLWLTRCDANQLESALLNLGINARDAMPEGGKLDIALHNITVEGENAPGFEGIAAGDYVCVTVLDSGCGMEQETIDQAFEPFFTTKPIGQGTGLGLSMVYGFARQSQGYARIKSAVGQGTTISLYLPRFLGEMPAEADSQVVPSPQPVALAGTGKLIVVVEDEEAVRVVVVAVLQDLGFRTLEAADGVAGLEILERLPQVDLLITDVGLPGLNGRQVADAARLKHPKLKVLFMTGYADKVATASKALQPGMHMITKPVGLDVLTARVNEILESVPAEG